MRHWMKNLLIVLPLAALVGCSAFRPYRPSFEQGTDYTDKQVQRIKLGMSPWSCAKILGPPVTTQPLNVHKMVYVRHNIEGYDGTQRKTLTLRFKHNKLVKIEHTGA